ncbi:MAG: fibronectin type III domain-containing protein [Actinobacteria bacterium]|nr:fibronectin type III domain-containing protein [Actinomycetota bacterium]
MGDNLPFVALGFTTGVRTAIGRPNAPTSVQATPSSTTVTLSWTAPSDSGGSAITGYRIDRSTDGRNWITATANSGTTTTTANITSLSAATTHYFRVAGINAVGVGAGSTTKVVSTSAGTPSGLVTLTPTRIINTRPTGKIGNRTGTADPMTFNVYNKGGLPASGIGAVLLNVTVVDPEVGDEGGYLTVYPCASGRPDASNLNFVTGQIIPNTVIAPVDPSGNICFYSYGKTHVLADVSGYFPS